MGTQDTGVGTWGRRDSSQQGGRAALTCLMAALKAPRMAAAPPQSLFIPGMVVWGGTEGTQSEREQVSAPPATVPRPCPAPRGGSPRPV